MIKTINTQKSFYDCAEETFSFLIMKSDSTSRSIPSAHNPRIKFKSTLWLLFMLVIVGVFHLIKSFIHQILNFISPCDGREGNLLTIVYKKMMGTYVQNIFGKDEW